VVGVFNDNPITVKQGTPASEVKRIMQESKVNRIPVVDDFMNLKGLHSWEEIANQYKRKNVMVIMAGGKGTRLLPKTLNTPKPMLTIAGKPILEHIIDRAKLSGIFNFAVSVHYQREKIENYFGDGSQLGVNISYLRESEPLGTAGALGLIKVEPNETILVTNGDVITEVNYGHLIDFHISQSASATMAAQNYRYQIPYGTVEVDGLSIVDYQEKPFIESLINAGVYVLDGKVVSLVSPDIPLSMPELFLKAMQLGHKVIAFPIHEKWMDLGTHSDFDLASNSFQQNRSKIVPGSQ
jgi:NDP-sugar pyrophosphorylase family protein